MPIKIQNLGSQGGPVGIPSPAETAEAEAARGLVFKRTLSNLDAQAQDARLTGLVAEIDRQGKKIGRRADVREFERYRTLIRQFMDEIVSNGYAFSKQNAFGGRGSHRLMATVNVVNQKLDDLAREVLASEADNLKILDMVDDIRGLLMDMML